MYHVDTVIQFLMADGLLLAVHFPDFETFVVDRPQNNSLHFTNV